MNNEELLARTPLEMLEAIKRHGELGNVSTGGWHGSKPAGNPMSKDVWQFPRHMLTEIDVVIAATPAASPVAGPEAVAWRDMKPTGCSCGTLSQARACYERCDDILRKPVAWAVFANDGKTKIWWKDWDIARAWALANGYLVTPLYAHPVEEDAAPQAAMPCREEIARVIKQQIRHYANLSDDHAGGIASSAADAILSLLSPVSEQEGAGPDRGGVHPSLEGQ